MRRPPPITEESMQRADANIPRLAAEAGRAAYERAMSRDGWVVMKSANGQLVERQRSGATVVIKTLPTSTPTRVGLVLKRARKPAGTDVGK
jgi:hypothetical protein